MLLVMGVLLGGALFCWLVIAVSPDPTHHFTGRLRVMHLRNLPLSGQVQLTEVRGRMNGKHYRIKVTENWLLEQERGI